MVLHSPPSRFITVGAWLLKELSRLEPEEILKHGSLFFSLTNNGSY